MRTRKAEMVPARNFRANSGKGPDFRIFQARRPLSFLSSPSPITPLLPVLNRPGAAPASAPDPEFNPLHPNAGQFDVEAASLSRQWVAQSRLHIKSTHYSASCHRRLKRYKA